MTLIGYARVSTTEQDLPIQEAALHAAGCDTVRAEKRSGTTTEGRAELSPVPPTSCAGKHPWGAWHRPGERRRPFGRDCEVCSLGS
jgi:hypothetical protein